MENDKVELLKILLLQSNIMQEYDLKFIGNINQTYFKTTGYSYELKFIGNVREVIFSCNPSYDNRTTIGIHIINTKTNGIITFADWLNQYYGYNQFDCFSWKNNEVDSKDKINELIITLKSLFKHEKLSKILKGEDWEYIPFGWFGQR